MRPAHGLQVGTALVVAAAIASAWTLRRPHEEAPPEARWRNGVIVAIRNCDAPASDEAELRCAALRCVQRVTERLTNAQQAKASLIRYVRTADGTGFEIEGALKQQLGAPTLPNGFICHMRDHRHATPEFLFGPRVPAVMP